ncbi:hypothetical protein MACJ_000954 [Theileria orientalis]|uniref:Pinin/SDK/MemA protein domain-containing protein n=1 Tax=Theileria orientalis TaxID=68886 RepID=A0A976M4W8_THEOR|nr:hypothetical protein MACJ_000954 [Theileria orientalis]
MTDHVTLQNEIRSLVQERKSLNLLLKRLSNQMSNFNEGDSNVLLSSKVLTQFSMESRRKPKDSEDFKDYEPEKRPRVEEDTETVHRHKRLMKVGLFGYLQKAKDALVKEKDDESAVKHLEKEKLIDNKLEERQKKQFSILAKDIEEQYNTSKQKLEALELNLSEKRTQLMRIKLKDHYENMKNFIATSTQPTIFWVPRRFNDHLESLRASTRSFVSKKIEIIDSTDYSS